MRLMLLTDGPDAGCRKPDAGALRPEEASALKPEWAELEHFAPLKRTPGDLNKKKIHRIIIKNQEK